MLSDRGLQEGEMGQRAEDKEFYGGKLVEPEHQIKEELVENHGSRVNSRGQPDKRHIVKVKNERDVFVR